MQKKKLTLYLDANVIYKAKEKTRLLGVSLSRVVENALRFFVNPFVYCFYCGKKFDIKNAKICPKCGWFVCPHCGACGCKLGDEGKRVAFFFRETLRDIFGLLEFFE